MSGTSRDMTGLYGLVALIIVCALAIAVAAVAMM
jgi:tetrahydromethanopterin S-methyltransferase subunit G